MRYLFIFLTLALWSCNWAKQKTKESINKTGEVVAKTGAEFVSGVSKGIEKDFQNEVVFTDRLKAEGLKSGKIIIRGTDSSTDNILTTYLIFDERLDQDITIKVVSEAGQEYGRVTEHISGQKGDAKYFDFIFDKRTNIDGRGKLLFQ